MAHTWLVVWALMPAQADGGSVLQSGCAPVIWEHIHMTVTYMCLSCVSGSFSEMNMGASGDGALTSCFFFTWPLCFPSVSGVAGTKENLLLVVR